MIQRRAIAADIATKISCHSFRANGITTYLQNGGKLGIAQNGLVAGEGTVIKRVDAYLGSPKYKLSRMIARQGPLPKHCGCLELHINDWKRGPGSDRPPIRGTILQTRRRRQPSRPIASANPAIERVAGSGTCACDRSTRPVVLNASLADTTKVTVTPKVPLAAEATPVVAVGKASQFAEPPTAMAGEQPTPIASKGTPSRFGVLMAAPAFLPMVTEPFGTAPLSVTVLE